MKRGGAIRKAVRVARLHKADGGDISSPNYVQANNDMNLTPQEQALYQRHLTNLNGPGGVDNPPDSRNPNGSRSTLYQSVQEHNGKFYNIPTVWSGARETQSYTKPDGTVMDVANPTALTNVDKAGWNNFPAYSTPDEADSRYDAMHKYMDKDTSQYFQNKAANMPTGDEIQPMKRGGVSRALGVAKGAPAFEGYIPGQSGGRTDNKDISVKSGSYVVPADILSGLGEGNSHAGWAAIAKEYGLDKPHKADGGAADAVPIVAASGEGVIPPDSIIAKHGDLDAGHAILDAMVKHVRSRTIKHLKRLPGPKKN